MERILSSLRLPIPPRFQITTWSWWDLNPQNTVFETVTSANFVTGPKKLKFLTSLYTTEEDVSTKVIIG